MAAGAVTLNCINASSFAVLVFVQSALNTSPGRPVRVSGPTPTFIAGTFKPSGLYEKLPNVLSPTVQEKPVTSQLFSVVVPHVVAAAISGAARNDVVISAAATPTKARLLFITASSDEIQNRLSKNPTYRFGQVFFGHINMFVTDFLGQ
jgi:hypothetical protein